MNYLELDDVLAMACEVLGARTATQLVPSCSQFRLLTASGMLCYGRML